MQCGQCFVGFQCFCNHLCCFLFMVHQCFLWLFGNQKTLCNLMAIGSPPMTICAKCCWPSMLSQSSQFHLQVNCPVDGKIQQNVKFLPRNVRFGNHTFKCNSVNVLLILNASAIVSASSSSIWFPCVSWKSVERTELDFHKCNLTPKCNVVNVRFTFNASAIFFAPLRSISLHCMVSILCCESRNCAFLLNKISPSNLIQSTCGWLSMLLQSSLPL